MASGLIPKTFISDLLNRVDIVDVINTRVPLKKAGREYTACCPFHNEKTPSFTVSPTKQFYHCFGCGAHGSAINFLMEYEHLDFVESVESLAGNLGIPVPREEKSGKAVEQKKIDRNLYSLMDEATQFFQLQLNQNPAAKSYLQLRGLDGSTVAQFKLGYSPNQWHALEQYLGQHYSQQQMLDVGLLVDGENKNPYERFRDRIIFPLHNRKGQVIGFGGRLIGNSKPKYLNSPETILFNKGSELYGFYEARQHTRKLEKLVVVEGYMDVIALAQYGISYVVATLGTATTKEHLQLMLRNVPEVIFCFDGDRAGRDAAWRALENALPLLTDGKEIRFLFLPDGEDPDSLIRKHGKDDFEHQLSNATALTDYLIQHLQTQFNLSNREGKARFVDAASKHVKTMPDSLIKSQLISSMEQLTGISASVIRAQKLSSQTNVQTMDPQSIVPHSAQKRASNAKSREIKLTPIRYAIALLLNDPELIQLAGNPEKIAAYDIPGSNFLANLLEILEESPNLTAAALIERYRDTKYEALLTDLTKWHSSTDDKQILQQEFQDCLRQIRKKAYETRLEALLQKERLEGLSNQEKHDLLMLLQDKD